MKRIVLSMTALALVLSGSVNANAQKKGGFYSQPYKTRNSGSFNKSTSLLSIGIGVPDNYGNYKVSLPPVYVKYEHGITDEIGIGLLGGLGMSNYKSGGNRYNYLETTIGALGYYHFNKLIPVSKLDVYLGAGIGLNIRDDNYSNYNNTSVIGLGKAGARYYFNPKFSVYAEAGYDNLSVLNAGITLRF
ncbi:outer membrane beta-barrel protein [Taibaiella sp. KBW10]|uniref:outer membrane beta-barrel protein n=1 Tax=Taibaiella sp. KBW10 TaxID=2153357 RepID=UPI0013154968|nr:outer membrane beta-barrel protein [Taibaiella sp. KBW10]